MLFIFCIIYEKKNVKILGRCHENLKQFKFSYKGNDRRWTFSQEHWSVKNNLSSKYHPKLQYWIHSEIGDLLPKSRSSKLIINWFKKSSKCFLRYNNIPCTPLENWREWRIAKETN